MPRSKAKPKRGAGKGGGGSRLQTVGLFLTLLAVAALIGSLAWGLLGGGGSSSPRSERAEEDAPPAASVPAPTGRVRVEVLNASGRPGLAREGTRVLRDRGFDVVSFGNAEGFSPDTSLVLDRTGRIETARQVADAVGIRRVHSRPDANLYLDATVVLGRDWRSAPSAPSPDP
ncbi:MAG TPA: LytR C-terminal domain-containing protein [Longimicrobium sp.]|nr:LytR C-terminal domain-containing protein [Longimicrobium sp.]